ncbi:MAG: hypothetical protein H8E16_19915 [Flavobacteriales bacterium]|nr:hypothetical protein [Flavobacteriales bacterium]
MAIDNLIVLSSQQTYKAYQETVGSGFKNFDGIALSGSGLDGSVNVPNSTLAKMSSGFYNSCWKTRSGWPDNTMHGLCKMVNAYWNGSTGAQATNARSTSIISSPDSYNNSTQAKTTDFNAGMLYGRNRYYFGVQSSDSTKGQATVTSPWYVGPAGAGRDAYRTTFAGGGTIQGFRNSTVAGGFTNSYNTGAVALDYMQLDATAFYPNVFRSWRVNSSTGTVLSLNASFNLYFNNTEMMGLNTVYCVFE